MELNSPAWTGSPSPGVRIAQSGGVRSTDVHRGAFDGPRAGLTLYDGCDDMVSFREHRGSHECAVLATSMLKTLAPSWFDSNDR